MYKVIAIGIEINTKYNNSYMNISVSFMLIVYKTTPSPRNYYLG